MPDITHVVYVDPDGYQSLPDASAMRKVGTVVGKLNKLLPKRQFILIGPGRWGSRGDIKLGVSVTYSEINNTAVLIEVARQRATTSPISPSAPTSSRIWSRPTSATSRSTPTTTDDRLQRGVPAPVAQHPRPSCSPRPRTSPTRVRVIDVPRETGGSVLRVLMNADLDEAVGLLAAPSTEMSQATRGPNRRPSRLPKTTGAGEPRWPSGSLRSSIPSDSAWRRSTCSAAPRTRPPARGATSIFWSTSRATPEQREELSLWLDGWSLCLAEINYLRTGYKTAGLLDVHFVTDEDIARKTSYAVKIGAVTDAARPLALSVQPRRASPPVVTRCLFATDLHGHLDRYSKLLHAIEVERPSAVFLGGDLLPSFLAEVVRTAA